MGELFFEIIMLLIFWSILFNLARFLFTEAGKDKKITEIDKTTYVKDALTLYYVDGTNEVFFYHKGCWYLKSEGLERPKYKACDLDMSLWLDKEMASIELINKNKEFKPKGL